MRPTRLLGPLVIAGFWAAGPAVAAPFFFRTGNPDALVATASAPLPGTSEIETADDFVVDGASAAISGATFTGLLPSATTLSSVTQVRVKIYRVFPADSDLGRTSGAPTFSTPAVPTRVNSPSDVSAAVRDSGTGTLSFLAALDAGSFTANNTVLSGGVHPKPTQTTGGNGSFSGEEVTLNVSFDPPILLGPDHYFVVPEVGVAPGPFLWLSAAKPIVAPGTPFPAGTSDLQTWIRDGSLAPDWLRVGTDVIGSGTHNAAFSLSGVTCTAITLSPSQLPDATVGSPYDQSLTASGGSAPYDFTATGSLPAGVTFGADGKLAGTPTAPGSFSITATATDANGCTGTAALTLVVNPASSTTTTTPATTTPTPTTAAPTTAAPTTTIATPVVPVLSATRLSATSFRAAGRGATLARKQQRPIGTTVSYRDSQAAQTTFAVQRAAVGHKRGGTCAAGAPHHHQKRCTRYVGVGSVVHTDVAGPAKVFFSARVRGRKLPPGPYRLVLTPRAGALTGPAVARAFHVVR